VLFDDDDEEDAPQSNITESPIQPVSSSGDIRILVDVTNMPINSPING